MHLAAGYGLERLARNILNGLKQTGSTPSPRISNRPPYKRSDKQVLEGASTPNYETELTRDGSTKHTQKLPQLLVRKTGLPRLATGSSILGQRSSSFVPDTRRA
jgi:hypothetical protein